MANEHVLINIRDLAAEMLAPYPEYFVVDVRIKPTNNIKLFVDGDNGVPVEKLVAFNRNLYPRLEGANLFPDNDFSLEVSSPGLDEPLKLNRQYLKNIGRKVAVTFLDNTEKEGTLLAATEEKITIEETVGKKKEKVTTEINLSEIKHTMVCIVF
ncbi:ribosome maturation factor [Chitinophaga oryziterrae]|uniref:Ribosome maturation factor RimP n=1 Tax=Chitinophaga oryziterrae TaxID=1031224 RepID=A0A6N8JBD1_9BACT|nr:ribosome maturation factor [Chitinophaga oryziterrae]MVT42530.1 ribosome maturation factor [Chitinophaga oryziterrae]